MYFMFCHDFPSWKSQRSGERARRTHTDVGGLHLHVSDALPAHKPISELQRGHKEQKTANKPISGSKQIVKTGTLGIRCIRLSLTVILGKCEPGSTQSLQ